MFDRLAELREKRENGEGGFTLIELLVVVVIIGILIAIAIPLYLNYKKGANDKSAQSDLRGAVSTLEQCNSDNSTYPSSLTAVSGANQLTACSGQTINYTSGTTITYKIAGTTAAPDATNYQIWATNSGGSGKVYCYASVVGGSVVTKSSSTVGTYSGAC